MVKEEIEYKIERHDFSEDKSLTSKSAADEYLLQSFNERAIKPKHLGIYNDRFGFLGCHLNSFEPTLILANKSQEKAININSEANKLPSATFSDPLSTLKNKMDIVLIKIPKSLGLFQLLLEHISKNSLVKVTVTCAFMTRHFSPKMLHIAEEYFEVVEQSRAVKKARVLILSKKKKVIKKDLITSLDYNKQAYKQYLGVFSADHIDYATQFFLEHIDLKKTDEKILDLGSGNGIIANEIHKKFPKAEMHLIDDSFLAVASAELNIKGKNIHHHCNNELAIFEDESFDLIVTNPPFHFEYEINIQIPLQLFRDSYRCLKKGGNLQMVASKHLNYKTHLQRFFSSVEIIAEDKKFIIYKCIK
ncbi:MAG: class I SAM-dependent methyltransferase [Flavobacteriales bacterium]|nr:class I SAM-dependent methyltransferase [Flavobacteriales bacterium]